jgi:hypothetical protein
MAPLNQCVTVARAVVDHFAEGTCDRLVYANGITAKAVLDGFRYGVQVSAGRSECSNGLELQAQAQ